MRLLLRPLLSLAALFIIDAGATAQQSTINQLKEKARLHQKKSDYLKDTAYLNTLNQLAFIYANSYPDTALTMLVTQAALCKAAGFEEGLVEAYKIAGNAYQTKGNFEKALEYYDRSYKLAQKIDSKKALPGILNNIGLIHLNQGNYAEAFKVFYQTLSAAELVHDKYVIGSTLNNIGTVLFYQGKMDESAAAYEKTREIAEEISDTAGIILAYSNLGEVNVEQKRTGDALKNFAAGYRLALINHNPEMQVNLSNNLANTYYKTDSLQKALYEYETALGLAKKHGFAKAVCKALLGLAKVQVKQGMLKPALQSGLEGLSRAGEMGQAQLIRDGNEIVASIYEASGDGNNAVKHYRLFKQYSDSLNNLVNERAAANYKASYEISKKQLEFERSTIQQRWLTFSAFAGLLTLVVIVWLVNRNRTRLAHTYKDLQQKNLLIEAQKKEVEETLTQLKAAQAQLIQAEKMASLGELTSGIAHEIQNPLNFVNNFSEVSKELLDEMKIELDNGRMQSVKEIANDVIENLTKINHHGKRADSIVKGMLQHSRGSSGQKEPTDINALCDEYLRLSYQGLRAKDKSFNAIIKTDFDESVGKIDIIPQDIGRVILNLLTNAFYAVQERGKVSLQNLTSTYEPTVSISTKKVGDRVLISVSDNGKGIPKKALDKIFQPFFTTKPTGKGTGLGLSLSYDIVKAHGGELTVKTKEDEYAAFVITLPK